ncbi:MAG: bifunctional oligoribonuclease/PAP phosphatase NrnA [Flavobacteriales bacterium]|nr:bifunctional oligoribonuclease/PAP phosphatase NrnA [Flavobacteriales bacterium]
MDQSALLELFAQKKRIVITTHRSPDGDAIGSSLALSSFLMKEGHDVRLVIPDAAPDFLHWMEGSDSMLNFELLPEACIEAVEHAEVIFSLDYNRLERIASLGEHVMASGAIKILIDHHIDPADYFDFALSDTKASSTSELIYRFSEAQGWLGHLDKAIAECLYTGIMTDTGSFKFSSTSADTHRIAAHLMDAGLVPEKVHSAIFDTNTYDRLQLLGHALTKKLEYDAERGVSIISLSLSEKNRFHYKKGDTEGLVNYGLSIQGTKMAVFLSEELNITKCSFRSKGDVDVNVIARTWFNGGGHKNAAGGRLDMKLEPALSYLKDVIEHKLRH